jgi:cellulose biosynthesis protein BcsQ
VLGILAYNAFVAADLLLVPVQPGVGVINGLDVLLNAAGELRE